MTDFQKIVKYIAMGFAALLAVSIIGGIIHAVGIFGGFVVNDATTEDMRTYSVSSPISSLYVDINAADITVKEGTAFSVESNLKYLTVEEKNGLLSIKEQKKLFQEYNHSVLVLTLPAGTVFENAELKTGAGRLIADSLSAKTLDCDFGAGEIQIAHLSASSKADIDGGAGKITISGGSIHGLDFDMGVGQLNFTALLTGQCELDLGVGESNITLLGSKADYALDIEKGLGNITVDGNNVTDFGSSGNGQNKVELNGGIGAINVTFREIATK